MMRILTLSYEFPPIGGGGSRVVAGLAGQLARAGHAVDLVTMAFQELPRRETVDGIEVHRVRCFRRSASICSPGEMAVYLMPALRRARGLAQTRRYDLIHAHFIFPDGVLALALAHLTGLPYVITAHGSDVPGFNPDRFRAMHRVLAPLWRRVVRGAELLISPSHNLTRLIDRAAPAARTVLIPNGIAPARYRADRPRLRRILVVSRLFERKGVQNLIRALAGVTHDHELHVVGAGPYQPELRALSERLAVPVNFHGWLEPGSAMLAELYETASIFVLPSEMENFPIVLLEAMAAGAAIVTTRGTGCDEVVGDAGVLVPPGDPAALRAALVPLMADPSACRALGAAARRRLEQRFSWAAVARRYTEVYQDVIGAPPGVPEAAGVAV